MGVFHFSCSVGSCGRFLAQNRPQGAKLRVGSTHLKHTHNKSIETQCYLPVSSHEVYDGVTAFVAKQVCLCNLNFDLTAQQHAKQLVLKVLAAIVTQRPGRLRAIGECTRTAQHFFAREHQCRAIRIERQSLPISRLVMDVHIVQERLDVLRILSDPPVEISRVKALVSQLAEYAFFDGLALRGINKLEQILDLLVVYFLWNVLLCIRLHLIPIMSAVRRVVGAGEQKANANSLQP
jgi:hypothetical protein